MKTVSHNTVTTINGRFVERDKAKISVFDNSLLYAEGLFETLLAIDKKIIFLDEHIARLKKGANVIGLSLPVSEEKLIQWMNKTVQKHPERINKLRLTVTSGEAERWVGKKGKPQIILSCSPHVIRKEPYHLDVSNLRVDQESIFRRIKTISYAIHAAALKKAELRGYDDAILLNEKNKVAEVTSANIFWIKKNKIYTPPIDAGCLEGVTRKKVLQYLKKIKLPATERLDSLQEVLKAEEIFITSSLKLIVGVSLIADGRKKYKFHNHNLTNQLADGFSDFY